ncbi:MAG: molecular chaperone HtpG, partial [Arcticibacterium sp.]
NGNSPIIAKMLKMKGEDRRQVYAKQLHDLALLSQGMLSGGNLTDFVNRTFEEMA